MGKCTFSEVTGKKKIRYTVKERSAWISLQVSQAMITWPISTEVIRRTIERTSPRRRPQVRRWLHSVQTSSKILLRTENLEFRSGFFHLNFFPRSRGRKTNNLFRSISFNLFIKFKKFTEIIYNACVYFSAWFKSPWLTLWKHNMSCYDDFEHDLWKCFFVLIAVIFFFFLQQIACI